MVTGKKLGFKKGDFVMANGFPGIVVSQVHTFAPVIEAWGIEHECGSAYATALRRISGQEFLTACAAYGHVPFIAGAYTKEAKEALKTFAAGPELPLAAP